MNSPFCLQETLGVAHTSIYLCYHNSSRYGIGNPSTDDESKENRMTTTDCYSLTADK